MLARRALAILDAALERPDAERASWLEHECDGDATLLREVQALLEATRRSDGILDADALAPEPGGLATALGSALAGSYAIAHEIGRGGMATVFKAHEHKHDRDVVIKVLDPSIAHLFGADRFLREVRIAATLAHPHIVPLIDSGDADGLLYYVMPWMEGETLRERLRRGRPSREEALSILCDVAGALAFAHDAGIVHRDLKPENVLLTAGHAYLLDFGIAKLLEQSPEALVITTPGLPLGTRRYMAPEQAVGAADVDARADIYAWGILGIELLTGVPLPTADAEGAAARLLATHPEFPTTLVALLQACVATAPDRRPATMTDVVEWLNAASIPAPTLRRGRHRGRTAAPSPWSAPSRWRCCWRCSPSGVAAIRRHRRSPLHPGRSPNPWRWPSCATRRVTARSTSWGALPATGSLKGCNAPDWCASSRGPRRASPPIAPRRPALRSLHRFAMRSTPGRSSPGRSIGGAIRSTSMGRSSMRARGGRSLRSPPSSSPSTAPKQGSRNCGTGSWAPWPRCATSASRRSPAFPTRPPPSRRIRRTTSAPITSSRSATPSRSHRSAMPSHATRRSPCRCSWRRAPPGTSGTTLWPNRSSRAPGCNGAISGRTTSRRCATSRRCWPATARRRVPRSSGRWRRRPIPAAATTTQRPCSTPATRVPRARC
ncbi:MAG: protein kinase [Gemmatimonadetes bacterium]|nr:protein kinase [Gemmatimonadota bacterium]